MGTYVYKVGTKPVGKTGVHPSKYAYKPYWFGGDVDARNARARFQSGAASVVARWDKLGNPGCLYSLVDKNGNFEEGGLVREAPKGFGGLYYDDSNDHPVVGVMVKGQLVRYAELDKILQTKTAFHGVNDLLNAGGNYRPSLDVRQADLVVLADAYDAMQKFRGDDRRAYRYGVR